MSSLRFREATEGHRIPFPFCVLDVVGLKERDKERKKQAAAKAK